VTDGEATSGAQTGLRVGFVPGVTPGKWGRIWEQRLPDTPLTLEPVADQAQLSVLTDGLVDMCLLRLPVPTEGLHVIPLYVEQPVVVVPKDHPVAAYDEVDLVDLADEHLLQPADDVPEWRAVSTEHRERTGLPVPEMTTAQAVETVAAGAGIMVLPMSLARLHHRRDVTYRPVTGVAGSQVGLAWPTDGTTPLVETFIGIVRGRTARSSRVDPATRAAGDSGNAGRAPRRGPPGSGGSDRSRGDGAGGPRGGRGVRRDGRGGRGRPGKGRRGRRR
jgi:DNA-binding transcriptional LysR family regulator